jgi:PAS domain S-box-containing protein
MNAIDYPFSQWETHQHDLNDALAVHLAFAVTQINRLLYLENRISSHPQDDLIPQLLETREILKKSQALHQELMDRMPAVFLELRPDGKIVFANRVTLEISGYSADELNGKPWYELIINDEQNRIEEGFFRQLFAEDIDNYDVSLLTRRGSAVPIKLTSASDYSKEGSLQRIFLFGVEVNRSSNIHKASFDNSPDPQLVVDSRAKILDANPAASLLVGYSREELLNISLWDLTLPDDLAELREDWRSFLEGGVLNIEFVFLKKDGGQVNLEVRAQAHILPDIHLVVLRDLAGLIEIEKQLLASRRRYKTLIENSIDGIAVFNPDASLQYSSQSGDRLLGYTGANMIGWKLFEFVHPDDLNMVADLFERLVAHPQLEATCQCRIRHQDGTYRWIEAVARNLIDDPVVNGLVINYRDISERKQAEQEVIQRNQELAALSAANLALTETLDVQVVLERMFDFLNDLVPYDSASVLLLEGNARLAVYATRGYERCNQERMPIPLYFEVDKVAHLREILGEKKSLIVSDTLKDPDWDRSIPGTDHIRNWLGVPLIAAGQVIGIYGLDKVTSGYFTEEHLHLIEPLAAQAAVAIHNARLFQQVHNGRERLQQLSRRLVDVQEAERRRIARELHDEIGQILTGLNLILGTTQHLPPDGQSGSIAEAQSLVNELLGKVRQLSLDLRPAMLDDLGLIPALLCHLERFGAQTDIQVLFRHSGIEGRRFKPQLETAVFRITQEALTNVARHASVSQAEVWLWADDEYLGVQVVDKGIGFDPESSLARKNSSGLLGMRERATLLGGQLTVFSAPEGGTRLTGVFPIGNYLERRLDECDPRPGG